MDCGDFEGIETVGRLISRVLKAHDIRENVYPEAACNPSPREPPVTTATLPSREKMFSKSLSLT